MESEQKISKPGDVHLSGGNAGPGGPGGNLTLIGPFDIKAGDGLVLPPEAAAAFARALLNSTPPAEDLDQMFSSPALAKRYGRDPERLRKQLDYWRTKNIGSRDWTEVENRSANEPKYLYRLGAVLPIVRRVESAG
jgi:hypothetical protein